MSVSASADERIDVLRQASLSGGHKRKQQKEEYGPEVQKSLRIKLEYRIKMQREDTLVHG